MTDWQPATRFQKNSKGDIRALVGDQWVPVERMQKNSKGEFRVLPKQDVSAPPRSPESQTDEGAPPSNLEVIANAPLKGIAGAIDSVGNTPNRVMNLGRALYGSVAMASGLGSENAPALVEDPSYATKLGIKMDLIRELPNTAKGQRVLDAAVQTVPMALLSPTNGAKEIVANVITNMMSGAAGQAAVEATGSPTAGILAGLAIPGALSASGKIVKPVTSMVAKTVEPLSTKGQAAIKARALAGSLDNNQAMIQQAIRMSENGVPVNQIALRMKNSGLASFADDARNASPAVKDLYTARDADVAEIQRNALLNARDTMDVFKQRQSESLADAQVSADALRASQSETLAKVNDTANALRARQSEALSNTPRSETGSVLADVPRRDALATKELLVTPAYREAFALAGDKPNIDARGILGTASVQRADTLTQLKSGLAPETQKVLELFAPTKEVIRTAQSGSIATNSAPDIPTNITLEQAHALSKALNMDISNLAGSSDSAARITETNLMRLKGAVGAAINESDLPQAAKLAYIKAQQLHGTKVGDVYQTGPQVKLERDKNTGMPQLAPSDIASTILKGTPEDAAQFMKVYSNSPVAKKALKSAIEREYRDAVINPKTGLIDPSKHAKFVHDHADNIAILDSEGVGVGKRLVSIGKRLDKIDNRVSGAEAAVKAKVAEIDENLNRVKERSSDQAKQDAEIVKLIDEVSKKVRPSLSPQDQQRKLDKLLEGRDDVKAVVADIQKQLAEGKAFDELATQGRQAGGGRTNTMVTDSVGGPVPNAYAHSVAMVNTIMNRVKGGLNPKLAVEVAHALMDTAKTTQALKNASKFIDKAGTSKGKFAEAKLPNPKTAKPRRIKEPANKMITPLTTVNVVTENTLRKLRDDNDPKNKRVRR